MKKFSPKIKTLLRILISVVLIAYIVKTQDFSSVLTRVTNFDILKFVIAFFLLILGTVVSAFRWREILNTSGIKVGVLGLFSLYLKGYFYNNFLPTQMGGDFYKAAALSSSINNKSLSFFSVFVDRFSGLIVLMVLAAYGVSIKLSIYLTLLIFALIFLSLFIYLPLLKLFSKKIKFLKKFYQASELIFKNPKSGILILLYSFLIQVFSFSMSYVLFTGFNVYLNISDVIAFMPLVSLSLLIPSFNGWGAQELVYSNLFSNSGVIAEISIGVSLLIQAIRLLMSLVGGLFILVNFGKVTTLKHENS